MQRRETTADGHIIIIILHSITCVRMAKTFVNNLNGLSAITYTFAISSAQSANVALCVQLVAGSRYASLGTNAALWAACAPPQAKRWTASRSVWGVYVIRVVQILCRRASLGCVADRSERKNERRGTLNTACSRSDGSDRWQSRQLIIDSSPFASRSTTCVSMRERNLYASWTKHSL